MVSPDRGKPLKLQHKLQISAIEISWQPEPQVPFLRAYGMQFRGFIVSYSLVIKFHKTGNNVLNSTVIEIFHGKGNCLGTKAGPYGKSRTVFINWYLLISCHNQFYCFSFNPFLLSTLKRIRKKMYIINFISQGRLLPRNLMLAGFTILPRASTQEEDYYLVFSSYNFMDIRTKVTVCACQKLSLNFLNSS